LQQGSPLLAPQAVHPVPDLQTWPDVEQLFVGGMHLFGLDTESQQAPAVPVHAVPVEQHVPLSAPHAWQVPVTQLLPELQTLPVQHGPDVAPHAVQVPVTHTALAD